MKNISLAIIEVMKEIEWVAKAMTVWKWDNSYKWVADKDVKQALRDSMTKNWLSLLPTDIQSKIQIDRWEEVDPYSKSVPKDMKSKQSVFTEVTTKYILLHTSGESIELAWYWQGVDTQDKWAGKATTYALKNTLLNMFLIPTGVDTDNTHSDEYDVPAKKVNTPTWWTAIKYFWVKDLERCEAEWFASSKEAIKEWSNDNGLTIWKPLQDVIIKYLETGEITQPIFNK